MNKTQKIKEWIEMYGTDVEISADHIYAMTENEVIKFAEFFHWNNYNPFYNIFTINNNIFHKKTEIQNALNHKFDIINEEFLIAIYDFFDTHHRSAPEKWNGDIRYQFLFMYEEMEFTQERRNYDKAKELVTHFETYEEFIKVANIILK
jgi:hypothetical protein